MYVVQQDLLAVGGNRHPSAADWKRSGACCLAFGADCNIALWQPLRDDRKGIHVSLRGHTAVVTAVKFYEHHDSRNDLLLSGSADGTICAWIEDEDSVTGWRLATTVQAHEKSVNAIAVLPQNDLIVSAAAKAEVKVWRCLIDQANVNVAHIETCALKPLFFPLAIALSSLASPDSIALAVGGTKSVIQLLVSSGHDVSFKHQASLTGHEGWIRSLDFTRIQETGDDDLLLASASQDKYVRLWRFSRCDRAPAEPTADGKSSDGSLEKALSNKAYRLQTSTTTHVVTFEALLIGHEDWIYTAKWSRAGGSLQLLSASADNSLSIWELDEASGVWTSSVRLGEISAQKGATTATGSTGGFWIGLWSPSGTEVVSLGRTGSWRLWRRSSNKYDWDQDVAVTGHTKDVRAIAWSRDGSYLLSTGADQTTRLFSEWKQHDLTTWHEVSRPQIHGFDLNCLDTLGRTSFVSGADEKLLRVFDEPRKVADSLSALSGQRLLTNSSLPDTASIPVLGLSNKAMEHETDQTSALAESTFPFIGDEQDQDAGRSIQTPPHEDQLARHLLWPETEKLYGHGYEICAVACSHDGTLVASACRATAVDHAVIRLYETKLWHEIKPALVAHSLTVTAIKFSADDRYILSVGRDRQCVVYERCGERSEHYQVLVKEAKAHTRMILDASWAPIANDRRLLATAGRDKVVAFWELDAASISRVSNMTFLYPVTTVAFANQLHCGQHVVACGLEDGSVAIVEMPVDQGASHGNPVHLNKLLCPSRAISELTWRPAAASDSSVTSARRQLATASEDASVRILTVDLEG
ncbi:MAG: hypothetical protein M1828_005824 [Chrysothrix sp. TS-e1954]|nr:MAG: hypothetical protein M1828_005824 [Chrysothrix sp. TS-e1954]